MDGLDRRNKADRIIINTEIIMRVAAMMCTDEVM